MPRRKISIAKEAYCYLFAAGIFIALLLFWAIVAIIFFIIISYVALI